MTQAQHIVVVDDEQPAREMVGDYLRMHGFSVSLCDGGASLRVTIAQQMPDLIVLDLNMPAEDGLSIIRDLKQRIGVPIIMLTATASAIDRVVGLELGADDYLAKPCELRELLARIRSVLRRSTPGAQPTPAPTAGAPAAPTVRGFGSAPSGSTTTPRRCGTTKATSTRSRLPNTACSRSLRPIPNGSCPATGSWSSPMPATPRLSTAPSTCGSCGSAERSSLIRRIPRSSGPSAAGGYLFSPAGDT